MSDSPIRVEIRYPPLFRLLNGISVLVFLGIAFLGWMAYLQEGVGWGLPAAVIMLALTAFWLFALAASPQLVQFGEDHLLIRRWLGTTKLAYQEISAVRQSRPFIILQIPRRTIRLYKLYANTDAKIMTALEKYVPAANTVQQERLRPSLPFTFQSASTGAFGTLVGMVLLLGGGIATFVYLITEPDQVEGLQWVCIPFFSFISTGFGLLFLYMLVRQYPRKYLFTPSEIRLQYLFHAVRHPAQGLRSVTVKESPRTVRGVPRNLYQLELAYANGATVLLEPNAFAFPMDYIDAKEAKRTADLAAQIRYAYQLSAPEPEGQSQMPATPTPLSPASPLLEQIERMTADDYYTSFETLRDELNALGPEALPAVLDAARSNSSHRMIDLLVTVLADAAYPPAMRDMVEWLEHPNEEVRFVAAYTLDTLADGRFNIEGMIAGGWVQHDQIQAAAPAIRQWFEDDGYRKIPSLPVWLAQRAARPTFTHQEKRYNFIEINPRWVMLGNAEVFQPEANYRLPRNQGVHVIGGMVRLHGEAESRPAVFEMDSVQGVVQKVVIKENGRWLDISQHLLSMTPHYRF
ncbi:MAG: hypothetical protein WAM60_09520 [Candidatus Promineifilaceae bacterium]